MRIWGQTIVPPAVTATLYFVIFGSLIGRRVGLVGGYDYMQFIAPGLIMMTVITNSYGNVVSSFFGAKFGKHLEELLVSPLPNWLILSGYVAGGMLRGMLVGAVVTIVALFFTRLAVQHVLAMLLRRAADQRGVLARRLPQRAVRQEFRPDLLVPDLRAHAAHLPGRRVLFDHDAAALGASRLSRQSDPVHGQRIPLRLPRELTDVDLRLAYGIMIAAAVSMFALAVTLLNRGTGIRDWNRRDSSSAPLSCIVGAGRLR